MFNPELFLFGAEKGLLHHHAVGFFHLLGNLNTAVGFDG